MSQARCSQGLGLHASPTLAACCGRPHLPGTPQPACPPAPWPQAARAPSGLHTDLLLKTAHTQPETHPFCTLTPVFYTCRMDSVWPSNTPHPHGHSHRSKDTSAHHVQVSMGAAWPQEGKVVSTTFQLSENTCNIRTQFQSAQHRAVYGRRHSSFSVEWNVQLDKSH